MIHLMCSVIILNSTNISDFMLFELKGRFSTHISFTFNKPAYMKPGYETQQPYVEVFDSSSDIDFTFIPTTNIWFSSTLESSPVYQKQRPLISIKVSDSPFNILFSFIPTADVKVSTTLENSPICQTWRSSCWIFWQFHWYLHVLYFYSDWLHKNLIKASKLSCLSNLEVFQLKFSTVPLIFYFLV